MIKKEKRCISNKTDPCKYKRVTILSHKIALLFLNVNLMLTHPTAALVFPLRLPLALNQTTLVMLKDIMQ